MVMRAKISPHHHSGKLLPHHHTSYFGLGVVLFAMGLFLLSATVPANADRLGLPPPVGGNPQSGSVGLTGIVKGPPPSNAGTIITPTNGQTFTATPITVSGLCTANLLVSIFSNDVFVGSVVCTTNGTYSLLIDLFDGQNTLVAKVSDALGQDAPDSNKVTVSYQPPNFSLASGNAAGKQLFLESTQAVQGTNPNQALTWGVIIVGGQAPYAMSWDWGDGTTDLVSRSVEGSTSAQHTYARAGNYRVIARVTDSAGNTAMLQMVTVVNGSVTAATKSSIDIAGLLLAWPIYVLACILVLTFWLGERRELKRLQQKGQLLVTV